MGFPAPASAASLSTESKTDPDLITDRQLYWALGRPPSDLSHGHTDHC